MIYRALLIISLLPSVAIAQQADTPKALPDVRRAMEDFAVNLAAKCYDDGNTEISKLKAEIEKLKQEKESK